MIRRIWRDRPRRGGIAAPQTVGGLLARLGRLLNVLAQPDAPDVGIAIDSYTAAEVTDGKTLHNVFGLYSIGILDAETLGAATEIKIPQKIGRKIKRRGEREM